MATTVDSLEVKISTTIGDCNQKLDRLIGKLSQVSKALKMIENGKTFEPFTEEAKRAEKSAKSIKSASEKVIRSYEDIKKASESIVKSSQDKASNFVSQSSVAEITARLKTIQGAYDTARIKLAKIDLTPKNVGKYENATKDVIAYEAELERLKTLLDEIVARDNERTRKHNAPTNIKATSDELSRESRYLDEIREKSKETSQSLKDVSSKNEDIATSADKIAEPMKNWGTVVNGLKETLGDVGYSVKTFADNIIMSMQGAKPTTEEWKGSLLDLEIAFRDLRGTARDTFEVIKNGRIGNAFGSLGEKSKEIGDTIRERLGRTFTDMKEKAQEMNVAFKEGQVKKGVLSYTQEYVNLQKAISKTTDEIDKLQRYQARHVEAGGSTNDKTYKQWEIDIRNARRELETLTALQKRMQLGTEGSAYNFNTKAIKNAFTEIKNSGNVIQKVFSNVFSTLGRFGSAVGSVVSKLGALKTETNRTKKATDKFNLSNINLAKSLFKTTKMLKLMIVRMVLRKVITGVTDGFKNLAQYSDKVNASMSLLWNSFRQLGNSIASAVSPLLNAFAPALNQVIQLVVTATNYINQLLSALTGLSTWTKAKTLTDSYADSLDKTANSAKKANKQLASFDALNNLTTQDKSTGTSPADMFEEEEIDEKVKSFADKVKDVWNDIMKPLKDAWNNVGSFVVDSFKNTAKKLKNLFAEIGKDFMTVWGEWKTQKMFENILLIIGRIVRTVGELADRFREAWKYNNNGLKILRAIRDVIYVIVDWILKAVEATESWAKKLDLKPLLTAIAGYMESLENVINNVMKILYGFYTTVLLKLSKWTLEKGLPQFFDIMKKFNKEVDWNGLQESINKIWVALEPFAEKIGQGLLDFFGYLMDKLTEFLNSDLLDTILNSIADFFNFLTDFDWSVDLSRLDESFTQYLESLEPVVEEVEKILEDFVENGLKPIADWTVEKGLPMLFDTLTELNNSGVITTVRNTLKDLWDILEPFAEKVGEGLIIFIGDVAKALDKFFKSEAWEWFIGTLKDWVANVDADEVARGLELLVGAFVGFKALQGVATIITAISNAVTVLTVAMGGLVGLLLGEGVMRAILLLADGIATVYGAISGNDAPSEKITALRQEYSHLGGVIDLLKDTFSGAGYELRDESGNIVKTFSSAGEEIITFTNDVSDATKNVQESVKDSVSNIEKVGDDLIIHVNDNSKSYIKANEVNTESTKKMKENITIHYEDVEMAVSNARETMELEWHEISKNTDEATSSIDTNLESFRDKTFGKETWSLEGIKEGLKESFENAVESIKEIWNKFAEWLNEKATFEIKPIEIGGKKITEGGKLELFHIPTYSTGGFVEDGIFSASSSELVGKFNNGKTAVANNQQIVDGIRNGVVSANAEQNSLLRQQNVLLQGILDKEFGISSDTLFRSVQNSANSYYRRTGNYAF